MRTFVTALLLAASLTAPALTQTAAVNNPGTPADLFPQPNPKFFDAASPSVAEVEAFLKVLWGYDTNRTWRVEAIQKTSAPGVAKVTIFVADKSQGNKVESIRFFTTPDGKHAIADSVFNFGVKPFEETRKVLEQRADGPSTGPAAKTLELVEFADMQCPHCKEAQPTLEGLHRDFPQAHVVFQNFPLIDIHPFAFKAAAYGNCVAQAKGDAAFFVYLQDVFDHQESLTPEIGDQTLANAVTKAGANAASVATCAAYPAAKQKVDAQLKLAEDLNVEQTPTLAVNGHLIPIGSVPYETVKQIVQWDAQQSGAIAATK